MRKVKLLKAPKFDLGALLGLHGESSQDDSGQKVFDIPHQYIVGALLTVFNQVEREFKEQVLENV